MQLCDPFTLKSDEVENKSCGQPGADGQMKMSGAKRCFPAPRGLGAFLHVAHPETAG